MGFVRTRGCDGLGTAEYPKLSRPRPSYRYALKAKHSSHTPSEVTGDICNPANFKTLTLSATRVSRAERSHLRCKQLLDTAR